MIVEIKFLVPIFFLFIYLIDQLRLTFVVPVVGII